MKQFDIVMIGNFAKDKLIVDGVEEIASGSGVYYGSVVVKRLGLKVGVITRLHPDDFHRLDELRAEGIDVHATPAQGTSGIANYYQSNDMERRITKPIGFGGSYSLADLPDWQAKVIMLTPLYAGEVDLAFLKALAKRAPVAMDIQGFIRVPRTDDLVFELWPQMAEGLKHVTYLKVDRAEAEFVTGMDDLEAAARQLASYGPKEIVLTQSSGITVYADGHAAVERCCQRLPVGGRDYITQAGKTRPVAWYSLRDREDTGSRALANTGLTSEIPNRPGMLAIPGLFY